MTTATSTTNPTVPSDLPAIKTSKAVLWTGRVLSTLAVLMLLFSAAMKLARPEAVLTEFGRLGYAEQLAIGIGVLELICAILYAIPQTAVFGAILLTAYLGGATATHVRVGDPFIGPVIIGIVIWIALYLREPRLRPLVLIRR